MKIDVKMKNHYFHSSVKRTNVFHVAQKKTLHLIKIEIHFVYVVLSTSVKEPLKAKTASNHWSASRMKRFRLVRRIWILIGYGISHDTNWMKQKRTTVSAAAYAYAAAHEDDGLIRARGMDIAA